MKFLAKIAQNNDYKPLAFHLS